MKTEIPAPANTQWITSFIWSIADDVLHHVFTPAKYRDAILPMVVIRRLDAVLERTKEKVLEQKRRLEDRGVTSPEAALKLASGQNFYNASEFTLSSLRTKTRSAQLRADFEAYLDGFSPNVQEIIDKFKLRLLIPTLVEADILGALIEKFLDNRINLSPYPVPDPKGKGEIAGLDNHAMGTIFEELIRKFNEELNIEAGEHFTPRDVVTLMADLVIVPIEDQLLDGAYTLYDGACGTGGMLTVAEEHLLEVARRKGKQVSLYLFGQEVQAETYAISRADLLLKGEGQASDSIAYGSTLSADGFPGKKFDFMLSNPPYGKSWKVDQEKMGGKGSMHDYRFTVEHRGEVLPLITRSSDGQLLFLVNKLSKMKEDTTLGSRIAHIHNGSSLFTGDAGQGESNIRRWILENDWLEAIIALPLNMFYNTGIATYVWVLTNRKPEHRRGKVQLIDATTWSQPRRKNLGKKNCDLGAADIQRILETYTAFEETEQSKLFPNEAFGYHKVIVERPLRVRGIDGARAYSPKEIKEFKDRGLRDEAGVPVIRKIHKGGGEPDPLNGLFLLEVGGKPCLVEYEPDPDLRDTENIPLLEEGGIEAFIRREVLPYVPDAWILADKVQVGYEISFTRYFYKPKPMRTLEEIRRDIEALEKETDGLLDELIGSK